MGRKPKAPETPDAPLPAAEDITTRADAKRHVLAGPAMFCRGPQDQDYKKVRRYARTITPADEGQAELLRVLMDMPASVKATGDAVGRLLLGGEKQAAALLDSLARPGCGYDFRTIIANGALDGARHPYTCPRCGVQGVYDAPTFPALTA